MSRPQYAAAPLLAADLREIFRERPENFGELVQLERARLAERGFVQWLAGGRVVVLHLSERAELARQRKARR